MNFKKDTVSSSKKPTFGQREEFFMQPQKKSVSYLTLFIVVVCTFLVTFVLFKNFDRITNLFSGTDVSTGGLEIGQTISLSGTLLPNGDFISYTHTLTTPEYGIVGLKSRTLDLNLYTGYLELQGTVEKELNAMYIVEIVSVSGSLASTGAEESLIGSGSGLYFPQAGVYFPAEFADKYLLQNNGENGVLSVKNIITNQSISLSYFACKKSDPNKDCAQLQKNIGGTAEKTFSTSYGISLYKLEGVTSWFFTNGNLYGYFINDVPEQEVSALVNAIIIPNAYYVQNTMLPKLQSLCTDGTNSLSEITTHTLGVDSNGLIVNIQGSTAEGLAACKVFVDPSQAAGGQKISYIVSTSTPSTPTPSSTGSSSSLPSLDTTVKQFPINLEKTMEFTSSKGYTIVFPSKNIAYESSNVDEDLGLPGVTCSTQMNVTKFADKATLNESPKIKVFTCRIKGTLNGLGNSIIQKTAVNGMTFLIQIADPAWSDFANNTMIN